MSETSFHISPVERPVIYSDELRNTLVSSFFLLIMDMVVQGKNVDRETKSFDLYAVVISLSMNTFKIPRNMIS